MHEARIKLSKDSAVGKGYCQGSLKPCTPVIEPIIGVALSPQQKAAVKAKDEKYRKQNQRNQAANYDWKKNL